MQNWQAIRDGKLSKEAFVQRARILDLIREWFRKEGFLEVETPAIVKHPDLAPDLDLFATDFVSKDGKYRERRYLQTSPEYAMKKLLGAGFEKIFQMSKSFRNAEYLYATETQIATSSSTPRNDSCSRHNPEFTMLEWYRVNADYRDMMSDTENMIKYVVQELGILFPFRPESCTQGGGVEKFLSSDSLCPPDPLAPLKRGNTPSTSLEMTKGEWQRLSVRDAYQKYAGLNLDELRTLESLRAAVEKKGYELSAEYSWDDLFFLVMLNEIEPKLGFDAPVFLYDYPASQAALAKKLPHTCGVKEKIDGRDVHFCEAAGHKVGCEAEWAERFELYINGVELCNAFSELVNPLEQRKRFEGERAMRAKMGKEEIGMDEGLLEALKTMPPSGGNALGVDRLVMVLLGKKSIEEVILFPWGDVS